MREWILRHPYRAILAFAFVVHVSLFFGVFGRTYFESHGTDARQYQTLAENFLQGRGLSMSEEAPYVPDAVRTPGYPFFLAGVKAVTGSFYPSLYLSLLLGLIVPLCGMWIMARFTDDRRWWLATGLALTLDPHLFYHSFIYGSEGTFIPSVALALVVCIVALEKRSWRWAAAAGAMTGIAVMGRPIVQFVPFLFAATCLAMTWKTLRRRGFQMVAACVMAFAVVVAPWLIRTYVVFGVVDYTNVGWFNMYTRVAATAEAIHTGRSYPDMRVEYLQRLHEKGYIEKSPVEELDVFGYEYTPVFKKEALLALKRFPKEVALLHISAFSTIVSQDQTVILMRALGWVNTYPSFSPFVMLAQEGFVATVIATAKLFLGPWSIAIIMRVVWFLLFVLSLAAPWVAWKYRRPLFPLTVFLLLFNLGIIALSLNIAAQASARYRAQYQFVQLPLALFTLLAWPRKKKQQEVV